MTTANAPDPSHVISREQTPERSAMTTTLKEPETTIEAFQGKGQQTCPSKGGPMQAALSEP